MMELEWVTSSVPFHSPWPGLQDKTRGHSYSWALPLQTVRERLHFSECPSYLCPSPYAEQSSCRRIALSLQTFTLSLGPLLNCHGAYHLPKGGAYSVCPSCHAPLPRHLWVWQTYYHLNKSSFHPSVNVPMLTASALFLTSRERSKEKHIYHFSERWRLYEVSPVCIAYKGIWLLWLSSH